jgi:hypothetical protein
MKLKIQWIVMAFASLLIYSAAVWSTHQHLKSQYSSEKFIIASALSHSLYGMPIGGVYAGFARALIYQRSTDIQQGVAELKGGAVPPGDFLPLLPTMPDGLGIVMVATVSLLSSIFGATLLVFPILAVAASALSVLCMAVRFPDARLCVVPLHFLLLTTLSLSPVGTEPVHIDQFSIGGVRYVGLLAILPAIHIAFEILDSRTERLGWEKKLATLLQVVTFVLCANPRAGVAYLFFATLTMVALALWKRTAAVERRAIVTKTSSIISVMVVSVMLIYAMAPSAYRQEGRVNGTFWHRLIVGLGTNPNWPFGDFASRYDLCVPPFSKPMQPGVTDETGNCIWVQYVRSNLPDTNESLHSIINQGFYGNIHERLERDAFLQILSDYPADVVETLGYKFRSAFAPLRAVLEIKIFGGDDLYARQLCLIGMAIMTLWAAWSQTAFRYRHMAAASALFLAWSFVPLVFAWGEVHTVVDVAYWCLATGICSALALIGFVRHCLSRGQIAIKC